MKRLILAVLLTLIGSVVAFGNILLTTPIQQLSVLGGTATVAYDTARVTSITLNTVSNVITAQVQIVSSAVPSAPALEGTYTLEPGSLRASLSVETLRFQQSKVLTGAQASAIAATVLGIKNSVEQSAITFGLIAGTQN